MDMYYALHTPSFHALHVLYVLRIQYSHSAGVGRTGTFMTLDTMMERLKERDDINIFEFITEMRTQRTQMVQALVSVYVMIRKMLFHLCRLLCD